MNDVSQDATRQPPDPREQQLLQQVRASFDTCEDPRLRHLMSSLVAHLHSYISEVRLTRAEWLLAVDFMTSVGRVSDDRRREVFLLSDVLGASMQVVNVNDRSHPDATDTSVSGPHAVIDSPEFPLGGDLASGAAGVPCWVEGTVTDTDGRPVARARVDLWGAGRHEVCESPFAARRTVAAGHVLTDDTGRYAFWTVTPTPSTVPYDGPVGELLDAVGRSSTRAAHLHLMVTARHRRTLVTELFVAGDPFLATDPAFSVRASLVKPFEPQPPDAATPNGRDLSGGPWSRVRFDIVLAPAGA